MLTYYKQPIQIPLAGGVMLKGCLTIPVKATSIVIFAEEGGYSRQSAPSTLIEHFLEKAGFGTLVVDLSTEKEAGPEGRSPDGKRLDLDQLTGRLIAVTEWLMKQDRFEQYTYAYLGSGVHAAAAIRAAAMLPRRIGAVICRSARLELASGVMGMLRAPILLLAGSREPYILSVNQQALGRLPGEKALRVIEGATNRFDEGASTRVAELAAEWLKTYLHAAARAVANA